MNKSWTTEELADLLLRATGEECACNINRIDEWLPQRCQFTKWNECPTPSEENGCWREYVRHIEGEHDE